MDNGVREPRPFEEIVSAIQWDSSLHEACQPPMCSRLASAALPPAYTFVPIW